MSEEAKPWNRPWTTQEIIDKAENWNLAGDVAVLNTLKAFAEGLLAKTTKVNNGLDGLLLNLDKVDLRLCLLRNQFEGLKDTQFIECRVYEEDETLLNTEEVNHDAKQEAESKEDDKLKELKEAVEGGLEILDTYFEKVEVEVSDSEDETEDSDRYVLRRKDPYLARPLPYVIGTEEWHQHWHVGLKDSSSDSEDEKSSEKYSESDSEDNVLLSTRPQVKLVSETSSEIRLITKVENNEPVANSTLNDTTTHSVESRNNNESSLSSQVPVPSNTFAEQLAAKLSSLNKQEDETAEPEINKKPINKVSDSNKFPAIFFDEPPPLEESIIQGRAQEGTLYPKHDNIFNDDDGDDVWNSRKEPSTDIETGEPRGSFQNIPQESHLASSKPQLTTGGLFDEIDSSDEDLFNKKTIDPVKDSYLKPFAKPLLPSFDDVPPELEKNLSTIPEKKKPVGGISLLGKSVNQEIGNIFKNRSNISTDSSDEDQQNASIIKEVDMKQFEDTQDEKNYTEIKNRKLNTSDPMEEFFLKKGPTVENKKPKKINLFDDDDDDNVDNLFQNSSISYVSSNKFKSDLFDDDFTNDDLFETDMIKSETALSKNSETGLNKNPIKTLKLFDDKDDFNLIADKTQNLDSAERGSFNDEKEIEGLLRDTVVENVNQNQFKNNTNVKEDLLGKDISTVSDENNVSLSIRNANKFQGGLFDDDIIDDYLFGGIKPLDDDLFSDPFESNTASKTDIFNGSVKTETSDKYHNTSDNQNEAKLRKLEDEKIPRSGFETDRILNLETIEDEVPTIPNYKIPMEKPEKSTRIEETSNKLDMLSKNEILLSKEAEKEKLEEKGIISRQTLSRGEEEHESGSMSKEEEPLRKEGDDYAGKEAREALSSWKEDGRLSEVRLFNSSPPPDDHVWDNKSDTSSDIFRVDYEETGDATQDVLDDISRSEDESSGIGHEDTNLRTHTEVSSFYPFASSTRHLSTIFNAQQSADLFFITKEPTNLGSIPEAIRPERTSLEDNFEASLSQGSDRRNNNISEDVGSSTNEATKNVSLFDIDLTSDQLFTTSDVKVDNKSAKVSSTEKKNDASSVSSSESCDSDTLKKKQAKPKHNLNINVAALLPGSVPPRSRNSLPTVDSLSSPTESPALFSSLTRESQDNIKVVSKSLSKKADGLDSGTRDVEILHSITKDRVKIPVKRRPSTRRGRKEFKKSYSLTDDNVDNKQILNSDENDNPEDVLKHPQIISKDLDNRGTFEDLEKKVEGTYKNRNTSSFVESTLFKRELTEAKVVKVKNINNSIKPQEIAHEDILTEESKDFLPKTFLEISNPSDSLFSSEDLAAAKLVYPKESRPLEEKNETIFKISEEESGFPGKKNEKKIVSIFDDSDEDEEDIFGEKKKESSGVEVKTVKNKMKGLFGDNSDEGEKDDNDLFGVKSSTKRSGSFGDIKTGKKSQRLEKKANKSNMRKLENTETDDDPLSALLK